MVGRKLGLGDLLGSEYVGREASSALVRQIQSTSTEARRSQAREELERVQSAYARGAHDAAEEDEEEDEDAGDYSDEIDGEEAEEEEETDEEEAELRRIMDEAMGIRDAQRENGELDEEVELGKLREAWEAKQGIAAAQPQPPVER